MTSRTPRATPEPDKVPGKSLVGADNEAPGASALQPQMEGISAALKMQAEILKRLHEQQSKMGEQLADTRRSEMMIQSTQSLNESFTGMRRVQERLLDRLDDRDPKRFALAPWFLALAIMGVVAAVLWAAHAVTEGVKKTGDSFKASTESLATASLDSMDTRLKSLEGRDTEFFKEELERLRGIVASFGSEKARLTEERDRSREELGAVRASVARIELDLSAQRTRAETSEREVARMTERALADQRILQEMNTAMEGLRAAAQRSAREPMPPSAPMATPKEAATPVALVEGALERASAKVAPAENGLARASEPVAGAPEASAGVRLPVPPELIEQVNGLLAKHRGSDVYRLVRVRETDGSSLVGVLLEVRGPDGALSKSVEAEKLALSLVPRGAILEMNFESGTVAFQQGIARTVKSPFFNNRYQLLAIGVDAQAWTAASLPFLTVK